MGTRPFISRPYKFSRSPLRIRGPAPTFGQDNTPLLQELLGIDEATYQQFVRDAVISSAPTSGDPSPQIPRDQAVASGLLAGWDPDYRERLGIS